MKTFFCLALIVVCNCAVNQAAVNNILDESALQFKPSQLDDGIHAVIVEHSRQRRQAQNQASVDVRRQGGGTGVNAQVGRVWQSNNGNTRVEANANWGRNFGHGGTRPNYGANVQFTHRF